MKTRVKVEAFAFILALIFAVLEVSNHEVPPRLIAWVAVGVFFVVLLIEICFVTPYNRELELVANHSDEKRKLSTRLDALQADFQSLKNDRLLRRHAAREACLHATIDFLTQEHDMPLMTLGAAWKAKIYELEENEDIVWVAEQLAQLGYGDPFAGIPEEDYLRFLTAARRAGKNMAGNNALDAYEALTEWAINGKLEIPWAWRRDQDSDAMPPSSIPDTGASPPQPTS